MIHRICVFCGSSPGGRPEYAEAAQRLGRTLVERKLGLVYGGGHVGLMGRIARTVLDAGGDVIGVIPAALREKEVAFEELSDLRVVDSMHDRKALMAELSDGFIAMPGGLGTLEEFMESVTWAQLGIHEKPCGLLNVSHYFDGLVDFLDHAVAENFVRPEHRAMILVHEDANALLEKMESYEPPRFDKTQWILGLRDT